MSDIKVTTDPATYRIQAGTLILGTTSAALRLEEGGYPAVLYVPRSDVAMAHLHKTDRQTTCPHKGPCSYYSVSTATAVLENAVWSYETPIAGMECIAGYLAFYRDKIQMISV